MFFIGLTAASLLPVDNLPDNHLPLGADKGIHILMYTILTLLARPALMRPEKSKLSKQALAITTAIMSYGILLEILQPLISTRNFEWTDILANTAGILCGYLFWQPNK